MSEVQKYDSHPLAKSLADTFKKDFFSADRSIKWLAAEEESYVWLDPQTVLAGTIDARGETEDGTQFFADWKTIGLYKAGKNNSKMAQVKLEWRMDPQSLCYGLLLRDKGVSQFGVRWAIKSTPPTTDFEWYTYTDFELAWWKLELLRIACNIRNLRHSMSIVSAWPTNLTSCTRYGWAYRCPLYDHGCTKLDFAHVPSTLTPRTHHKDLEDKLRAEFTGNPLDLVVLSSSSVEMWLTCQEKYRRFYEGDGLSEDGEALTVGTDFHIMIAEHVRSLIK